MSSDMTTTWENVKTRVEYLKSEGERMLPIYLIIGEVLCEEIDKLRTELNELKAELGFI